MIKLVNLLFQAAHTEDNLPQQFPQSNRYQTLN